MAGSIMGPAQRPKKLRVRGRVGGITKRDQLKIEGFEDLVKNLNRLNNGVVVEILEGAIEDGGLEALTLMKQLAPRSDGSGSRGYHGADELKRSKLFSRFNSRAMAVGIHRGRHGAWFLKYAELGTIFHSEQPFLKPTGRSMRSRMVQIVITHWRRAVRMLR